MPSLILDLRCAKVRQGTLRFAQIFHARLSRGGWLLGALRWRLLAFYDAAVLFWASFIESSLGSGLLGGLRGFHDLSFIICREAVRA